MSVELYKNLNTAWSRRDNVPIWAIRMSDGATCLLMLSKTLDLPDEINDPSELYFIRYGDEEIYHTIHVSEAIQKYPEFFV